MPDTAANYRMLHTMIRVKDLDKSLAFYTGPMGMKMLRKREVPDGKYTLAFVGYGEESEHCAVELTYNWDQEKPYDLGSGFGHLAVGVPDVYGLCEQVTKTGGKVTRAPGPVKFGTTVIAFVEDPDGYKIELIERKYERRASTAASARHEHERPDSQSGRTHVAMIRARLSPIALTQRQRSLGVRLRSAARPAGRAPRGRSPILPPPAWPEGSAGAHCRWPRGRAAPRAASAGASGRSPRRPSGASRARSAARCSIRAGAGACRAARSGRCTSGAAGRSSGPDPRSSRSTARSSRRCARRRTAR